MIVLDASAAVKLLFDERGCEAVRDWFRTREEDLVAPDLLNVEVTQAVVRRVNARQIAQASALAKLRQWTAFLDAGAIVLSRSGIGDVATAAAWAMRLGHPIKDCLYFALAIDAGCELATCDARFYERAVAWYPQIRLLAALS